MGRLFWKFFAFTWIAQLAGIIAIASTFWLTQPRLNAAHADIDMGPGASGRADAAAAVLHYAGSAAFREWSTHEPGPAVYAVDEGGHDVLGRPVDATLIEHAREVPIESRGLPRVRRVVAVDGHDYLLFSPGRGSVGGVALAMATGAPMNAAGPGAGPPSPGPEPAGGRGPGGAPDGGVRIRGFPPLAPLVTTLLGSLAGALGLAWYVAQPVRSLRTAFDAVASGNLEIRVAGSRGGRRDELADLGRDFDRMANRLQASMEGQRRLLHDVSHEMRSPLARLQAAAGLVRLKYGTTEPVIERIEEEIERIDRLLGDLLKLSRLEAGETVGAVEEVDLHELLSDVIDDANFEARAVGRAVIWSPQARGLLMGRAEMLHGAIENVVRNALKHAAECREIHVATSVDQGGSRYTISVLDTGPGVPEAELATLFTPFFRSADADAARKDGYGLGLAIARRSIEAHGGRISAGNRTGGGLEVTIMLPLREPQRGGGGSSPR